MTKYGTPKIEFLVLYFLQIAKNRDFFRQTFFFRLTPVSYLLQQHYDTTNYQRYGYNINNKLSRVAQQVVFEYKKHAEQSGFRYCIMEGINNPASHQIVINFLKKNLTLTFSCFANALFPTLLTAHTEPLEYKWNC